MQKNVSPTTVLVYNLESIAIEAIVNAVRRTLLYTVLYYCCCPGSENGTEKKTQKREKLPRELQRGRCGHKSVRANPFVIICQKIPPTA